MNVFHKELAQGRWAQMPLAEQMANIGSEVSRAFNWQKKVIMFLLRILFLGHWNFWI